MDPIIPKTEYVIPEGLAMNQEFPLNTGDVIRYQIGEAVFEDTAPAGIPDGYVLVLQVVASPRLVAKV